MNKRKILNYVNSELRNLQINHQIEELKELQDCIAKIIQRKIEYCTQCEGCNKYFLKCELATRREIIDEKTNSDFGYRDDDRDDEVEYEVWYEKCPICGHEREIYRIRI